MRVALIHHWLVRMRGGEKTLEAIAEIYPDADLFTLACDPAKLSEPLRRRRIQTTWLGRLPWAHRLYPGLLPLHPAAYGALDLSGYDLVITVDAALAKTVRPAPGATHVCYCLTPSRLLWDMPDLDLARIAAPARPLARAMIPRLRRLDREAADRVHHFIAISEHVRERVRRNYGRDAAVVYPHTETFDPAPPGSPGEGYLWVGYLTPYKRADLAVEAFTRIGRPLTVIGDGPERRRLERKAGPNVRFLGAPDDETVRAHLRSCRALIFPGEEDFGIVPVEAQMAGRPVIAYGRGGARETVVDGVTGLFFDRPDAESLADAVLRFEGTAGGFSPVAIRRNALRFTRERFQSAFAAAVARCSPRRHEGTKGHEETKE